MDVTTERGGSLKDGQHTPELPCSQRSSSPNMATTTSCESHGSCGGLLPLRKVPVLAMGQLKSPPAILPAETGAAHTEVQDLATEATANLIPWPGPLLPPSATLVRNADIYGAGERLKMVSEPHSRTEGGFRQLEFS